MPDNPMTDEQMENQRFLEMPDEEVVVLAQNGDGQALAYLLNKHKNFVRSKARSYFLIGADHEDIVQEGMIGLYKSIRDFQPARLASFRSFAELCVKRQIITAIKAATRQKHVPLNSYVSLNKPLYDEESDRTLLDVIEGRVTNPEDLFISQEDLSRIQSQIRQSSFCIISIDPTSSISFPQFIGCQVFGDGQRPRHWISATFITFCIAIDPQVRFL